MSAFKNQNQIREIMCYCGWMNYFANVNTKCYLI